MNQPKDKIIEFSRDLFFKEGFYKTSMDDIARGLNMSKKTLYKHFSSKDDLVEACIKSLFEMIRENIDEILSSDLNAVQKVLKMMNLVVERVPLRDSFLRDLQLHAPELWKKIDEFRATIMQRNFSRILLQGKKEGLIKDVPNDIVLAMLITCARNLITPDYLISSNYTFSQMVSYIREILLCGILTPEGLKLYNKIKGDLQ
ncbi:MAG TPA: TetR/AcrR family transcriptional regulator [Ignavibacteriales bacterium]|nr:TetR/AcrR family transcriptional regulator [Ignavibacteriales bacterium]